MACPLCRLDEEVSTMVVQRLTAACLLFALGTTVAGAQELTKVKLTLDWKVQGRTHGFISRATRVTSVPPVST
jgi:hypothetical protein